MTASGSLPAHGFWAWAQGATSDVVRSFIELSGTTPDHPDADGLTLLHELAICGADPGLLAWVIERVRTDQRAADGATPFYRAVVTGHLNIAALLLEAGADPNAANVLTGWTSLVTAIALGDDDVVAWLCEQPALDPDHRDHDGATALHHAARRSSSNALRSVAGLARAHPDFQDKHGRTPLMEAARLGRVEAARILLKRPDTSIDLVDVDRRTALHHAVLAASTETVEALLTSRPTLNLAVTDRTAERRTALDLARLGGLGAIVKQLEERQRQVGAQPDQPANEPPPTLHKAVLAEPDFEVSIGDPPIEAGSP